MDTATAFLAAVGGLCSLLFWIFLLTGLWKEAGILIATFAIFMTTNALLVWVA